MACLQTPPPKIGLILEGLAMEDVGIFMAIWYIFSRFGTLR
jgi:hypothetical protein